MRRTTLVLLALMAALLLFPGIALADNGQSYHWLNDDDGDGIPNGDDPDYLPPEDGSGRQYGHGESVVTFFLALLDLDNGDQDHIRLRLKDGSCGD